MHFLSLLLAAGSAAAFAIDQRGHRDGNHKPGKASTLKEFTNLVTFGDR